MPTLSDVRGPFHVAVCPSSMTSEAHSRSQRAYPQRRQRPMPGPSVPTFSDARGPFQVPACLPSATSEVHSTSQPAYYQRRQRSILRCFSVPTCSHVRGPFHIEALTPPMLPSGRSNDVWCLVTMASYDAMW